MLFRSLWFTLNAHSAIGRWSDGVVTTIDLPTPGAGPVGISAGPNGVWFTELLAGQVGLVEQDGTLREHPLPDRESKPHAVAATPDGGCWVTLWGSGSLVKLDPSGSLTHRVELGASSEPHGLALDDDGSVWVALETGSVVHVEP